CSSVCPFFATFVSSSFSSRGPRLPLLTQLARGSLFGFWVTDYSIRKRTRRLDSYSPMRNSKWVSAFTIVSRQASERSKKGLLDILPLQFVHDSYQPKGR